MRQPRHNATRRALLALLLFPALADAQAHAATNAWNFAVNLDDKPIGHHRFTLTEQGGVREMKVRARFDARFYAVFSYHYAHDADEHWAGNCLQSLTAVTDDDGKKTSVQAQREGGVLAVTGARSLQLDHCVMTFAYWNPLTLTQSHLLNPQTGEYEAVRIDDLGKEMITVRGVQVSANHYRVNGPKHPINLWYSTSGEWLALESPLDGGRHLTYQLE